MSRRTIEANKAVRLAWERERYLVLEGKCTRDWTKEQQKDILDPDKGKAYDDKGRAFEGQHMKSVAEYPEYQGNPDNIQFLTKDEHLEAHKGNWQNPTNWYYNPVTKEFLKFGDSTLVPCEILELSESVVKLQIFESESEKVNLELAQKERKETVDNFEALEKFEETSPQRKTHGNFISKIRMSNLSVVSDGKLRETQTAN